MTRPVSKRKSPRHGQGRPEQLAGWAEHWQKARRSLFRRKEVVRLIQKPNPDPPSWLRAVGETGQEKP